MRTGPAKKCMRPPAHGSWCACSAAGILKRKTRSSTAWILPTLGIPEGRTHGRGNHVRAGRNAPRFLLYALKDPDGPALARLQLVKGWLDRAGELHERVYDLAGGEMGAAELKAQWRDPDFDPGERSFYYARVIEVSRPRWTSYDEQFFGTPAAADAPATVQDRAYSSPIWYTPHD